MISLLGKTEITSRGLPSDYAEVHRLRTIDLKYLNLLEMKQPNLNF